MKNMIDVRAGVAGFLILLPKNIFVAICTRMKYMENSN